MDNIKKDMINRVQEILSNLAIEIQGNDLSSKDKLSQLDVVYDTFKFLLEYDKNVELLNKARSDRRFTRERDE